MRTEIVKKVTVICPYFAREGDRLRHRKSVFKYLSLEAITNEVRRFKKFEQMLLGTKTVVAVKDIDIRNYAKFILLEGTMDEEREFLRCLKSEIVLDNKKISLK